MVFEKHEVYLKRIVMGYGLAFRMIWLQNVDQTPIGRDTGSNFRFTYYWICIRRFYVIWNTRFGSPQGPGR